MRGREAAGRSGREGALRGEAGKGSEKDGILGWKRGRGKDQQGGRGEAGDGGGSGEGWVKRSKRGVNGKLLREKECKIGYKENGLELLGRGCGRGGEGMLMAR